MLFKLREREYYLERLVMLKDKHAEVAHILDFLYQVELIKKDLYTQIKDSDWKRHIKKIYYLFEVCEAHGSPSIKEVLRELKKLSKEDLIKKMEKFLREKTAHDEERFIFISFLNPFFSKLSESTNIKKDQWLKNICPVCGFKPSVSYISDAEEVEGGRYLSCVLCNTEWLYNRTKCVRCGNDEDDSLEYYYDERERYALLQVCKKCNTYIKIIDMRIDGLAVPQFDDIATLYLDLWAKEKSFIKFEKSIIGL